MNGKTRSFKSSKSQDSTSAVPSIVPLDESELEEVGPEEERGIRLVVTGDNGFRCVFYTASTLGRDQLKEVVSEEFLRKNVSSRMGLFAITFARSYIIVSPQRDVRINFLHVFSQSSVGLEPGSTYTFSYKDLHLTLEMKVD